MGGNETSDVVAAFRDAERRMTLGSYRIGRATIVLHPTLAIWDDDGRWLEEATPAATAVFLHEYLHYLHNCSTYVGVMQTLTTMNLTLLYAQTLDRSGNAVKPLGAEHRATLAQMLGWWRHFKACRDADVVPTDTVAFGASTWLAQSTGNGVFQEARISTTAHLLGGDQAHVEFTLSVRELEEGLAYIFETMACCALGGGPQPADFVPYRVLPALASALVPEISDEDVFRLGCIALNCTNPSVAFMSLLDQCAADGTDETLSIFATADWFQKAHDDLKLRISQVEQVWVGRGLMEDGVHSFLAQARKQLDERRRSPWFELDATSGAPDAFLASVQALVLRHPPCDVLHGHPPTPVSFGAQDTQRAIEGRRCMDLAAEAMFAHLTLDREFRTDGTARSSCTLYDFCQHLTKSETRCKRQPWRSVEFDDPRCFYSHGIIALLAKVTLKPR